MSLGNFEGKTKDFQEVYKLNEQFEGFTFARGFLWFGGTSPCSSVSPHYLSGRRQGSHYLFSFFVQEWYWESLLSSLWVASLSKPLDGPMSSISLVSCWLLSYSVMFF